MWIAPDGSIRDVDVLRRSGPLDTAWLDRATDALVKRRYARLDVDPASPGIPRVRRLSFMHDVASVTGSRIGVRSPRRRLDIVDMTPEALPPETTPAQPIG